MLRRKKAYFDYETNRNNMILKKEQREELFKEELSLAKAQFDEEKQGRQGQIEDETQGEAEGKDVFNEEEWILKWEENKSVIDIPEDLENEVDNDYDYTQEEVLNYVESVF